MAGFPASLAWLVRGRSSFETLTHALPIPLRFMKSLRCILPASAAVLALPIEQNRAAVKDQAESITP